MQRQHRELLERYAAIATDISTKHKANPNALLWLITVTYG